MESISYWPQRQGLHQPSVSTLNSYHTAEDRLVRIPSFLGRVRSLVPYVDPLRSISFGRLEELQGNAFALTQLRNYSLQAVRQGVAFDSTESLPSLPHALPRTVSLNNIENIRRSQALQKEPLFVDIAKGHQVDIIFPPSSLVDDLIPPPRPLASRKAQSYNPLRSKVSTPVLYRPPSVTALPRYNQRKVPLFVPTEIIKPHSCSQFDPDSSIGDFDQDLRPRKDLSESSNWSTMVQLGAKGYEIVQPGWETTGGDDPDLLNSPRPPQARTTPGHVPILLPEEPLPFGLRQIHEVRLRAEAKLLRGNRRTRFRRAVANFSRKTARLFRKRNDDSDSDDD